MSSGSKKIKNHVFFYNSIKIQLLVKYSFVIFPTVMKRIHWILFFYFLFIVFLNSHPHVFTKQDISVLFQESGIMGFELRWIFKVNCTQKITEKLTSILLVTYDKTAYVDISISSINEKPYQLSQKFDYKTDLNFFKHELAVTNKIPEITIWIKKKV